MQAGTEITLYHHRPPLKRKVHPFSLRIQILANCRQRSGLVGVFVGVCFVVVLVGFFVKSYTIVRLPRTERYSMQKGTA